MQGNRSCDPDLDVSSSALWECIYEDYLKSHFFMKMQETFSFMKHCLECFDVIFAFQINNK